MKCLLIAVIIATIILIQMVLLSLGAQGYYKVPRIPRNEPGQRQSVETTISVIC